MDANGKGRGLPPELQFLISLPDLQAMKLCDRIIFCRAYLTRMKENRHAMDAFGMAADEIIADYEHSVLQAEETQREAQHRENHLSRAATDAAPPMDDAFEALETLVGEMKQQAPLATATQEAVAFLEEWRAQMPKVEMRRKSSPTHDVDLREGEAPDEPVTGVSTPHRRFQPRP